MSIAHRILEPLNFNRSMYSRVDGDVRFKSMNGERVAFVLPPKEGKHPRGVSFLIPTHELSAQVHKFRGSDVFGCGTIASDATPPAGLLFKHDTELKLSINIEEGSDEPVACGQHMTLYPEREMLASEFAALYDEFKTRFTPCPPLEASATASELGINEDNVPSDPLCYVAALALEQMAEHTKSPGTRLFSKLFALHICAVNLEFNDIISSGGALPALVADALDSFVAYHPLLFEDACDAQRLLAAASVTDAWGSDFGSTAANAQRRKGIHDPLCELYAQSLQNVVDGYESFEEQAPHDKNEFSCAAPKMKLKQLTISKGESIIDAYAATDDEILEGYIDRAERPEKEDKGYLEFLTFVASGVFLIVVLDLFFRMGRGATNS